MARGEKEERGPQALPATAEQVGGNFRNQRESGLALPREFFLDQREIVADKIKNLFDRQQGDGMSPKLFISLEAWRREARWLGKTKKAPKILCRGRGELFWGQVSHSRKRARHFRHVGGLVALAAIRLRREVRSVRLDQNF